MLLLGLFRTLFNMHESLRCPRGWLSHKLLTYYSTRTPYDNKSFIVSVMTFVTLFPQHKFSHIKRSIVIEGERSFPRNT